MKDPISHFTSHLSRAPVVMCQWPLYSATHRERPHPHRAFSGTGAQILGQECLLSSSNLKHECHSASFRLITLKDTAIVIHWNGEGRWWRGCWLSFKGYTCDQGHIERAVTPWSPGRVWEPGERAGDAVWTHMASRWVGGGVSPLSDNLLVFL